MRVTPTNPATQQPSNPATQRSTTLARTNRVHLNMTTPPRNQPDGDSSLLRLKCPHCQAEYPLWFRSEKSDDETLSGTEWEIWLKTKCRECGKTPGNTES